MIAEVIAIGDELTSGARVDTNSAWISRELANLGVRVLYHTTTADDLEACSNAFRHAIDRANLVISTGGLGPTADDLTRQAIAAASGCELQLDEEALAHIEQMFVSRGRQMPPANRVQAMFPLGCRVVPNPHGTAPGIDLNCTTAAQLRARIFALPGVPAEMREMWLVTVVPALRDMGAGARTTRSSCVKCFGMGESDLERMLPDLVRRGRQPSVGITVHQATITLRVTATADTPEQCDATMQPTIDTIHECLGDLVFGYGDDELQHAVARILDANELTLATVEVGTQGTLAHWLRELPRTKCYRGGVIGELDCVRGALLDPRPNESLGYESLGYESLDNSITAKLAEAIRDWFRADFGLAVGMPTDDTEMPRLPISLATGNKTLTVRPPYRAHPDILEERTAKQALNLLRKTLLKHGAQGP